MLPKSSNFSDNGSPRSNGFRVKSVKKVQLGPKKAYQATAISSTCETIALITRSEFQIFSIPKPGSTATISFKCCGFNDGRFGTSFKTAPKAMNPRSVSPTYTRGAMSDLVLCIACVENCIDIYETSTGRRIGTVEFPNGHCWTLTMSPNGEYLAAGMQTGEVLLYYSYERNFLITPTVLEACEGSKSVNCLAFSPNSACMSYCSGNTVRTCKLEQDVIREVSKYHRKLDVKACRSRGRCRGAGCVFINILHGRRI